MLDRHSASLVGVVIFILAEVVVKQVVLSLASLGVCVNQASVLPSTILLTTNIEFEILQQVIELTRGQIDRGIVCVAVVACAIVSTSKCRRCSTPLIQAIAAIVVGRSSIVSTTTNPCETSITPIATLPALRGTIVPPTVVP